MKYAELKTNFTCDQCDAKFVYQNTYDIHVQEHLNKIRPHKCPYCPESFFYEGGLNHHVQSHTRQKRSNSEVYGNEFSRGRKRIKTVPRGGRKRSVNSASHKKYGAANTHFPRRYRGRLIKTVSDMNTSEDSEPRKDGAIGMQVLNRLKDKKKNNNEEKDKGETEQDENQVENKDERKEDKNEMTENENEINPPKGVKTTREQELQKLEAFRNKLGMPNIGRVKGDPPQEESSKPKKPIRLTHSTAEEIKKLEEENQKIKEENESSTGNKPKNKNPKSGKKSGEKIPDDGNIHEAPSSHENDVKSGKPEEFDDDKDNNNNPKPRRKKPKGKKDRKRKTNEEGEQSGGKRHKSENSDNRGASRSLRSRTVNSVDDPNTSNPYESNSDYQEDDSQDEGFKCHICSKTFARTDEFKDHRSKCTKLKKKWSCPKCPKGFTQKALLDQHYDYYHTSKPKKFVCKPCNKDFPLKKSYLEHNRHLHNDGDYKYVCDLCGRGFFVKGEYTCHRLSHTTLRPYACGICQKSAFATPGQLNAHLKRCGKEADEECGQCGKKFSSKQSVEKHVREHHNKKVTWACPLCEGSIYSSEGGYYKHLRKAHNITRGGKKLEAELIKRRQEELEDDNDED